MSVVMMPEGRAVGRHAHGGDPVIIGVSSAVREAVAIADEFADTDLPVLVLGPTGVGKELLAGRIHARSGRAGALVPVNCAALPPDLAEAELFGARRGAYTGAVRDREGMVSEAEGGTLFLDEVCSLPVVVQAKLLRFLESGEYRPLGDRRHRRANVRIVAAAHQLEALDGESPALRIDLIQRIAGVTIALPSLAERKEDVEPLACHFAALEGCALDDSAVAVLRTWSWPGNVRELRHTVRRAARLAHEGLIDGSAIRSALALGAPMGAAFPPTPHALVRSERLRFLELVRQVGSDSYALSAHLGVSRATLFRRLKEWRLSLKVLKRSRQVEGAESRASI